jgi:hypothetical protein
MTNKNNCIPDYAVTMRAGIPYYRTRIEDADGKRVALYAKTPEELYRKKMEAREQVIDAVFRKENPTVAEYSRKWLLMQSTKITPATLRNYTHAVENHIIKPLGEMYMSEVTTDDIRMALVPLAKMSAATYSQVNMLIKCIFYSAERSRIIEYNPLVKISAKGGNC